MVFTKEGYVNSRHKAFGHLYSRGERSNARAVTRIPGVRQGPTAVEEAPSHDQVVQAHVTTEVLLWPEPSPAQ